MTVRKRVNLGKHLYFYSKVDEMPLVKRENAEELVR